MKLLPPRLGKRSHRSARERNIGLGVLAGCVAAIYAGLIWTMRYFEG